MSDSTRPPFLHAALAATGIFALYTLTLAPTATWWDASEYIATAYTVGIPHPPGNPLFIALAKTWTILLAPLGLSPAVRVNLFAAATSAGAFFFLFLIAHRILVQLLGSRWQATAGAAASVLAGATAYTVWSQSNANEKVYTLSLLIIAAVSWLAMRWKDLPPGPKRQRLLVAAVYLLALGSTSHLMSVLPAAALLAFVGLVELRLLADPRFLGRCTLAVVVGLSFNFFLPIRAAQRPAINEGDPLCAGAAETVAAIYTNGRAGCPALASALKREQYQKPPVSVRMAPFAHQVHNYFQYFDWQWARGADPAEPVSGKRLPFTMIFLALGLAGLAAVWRTDRHTGVYFAVLAATLSVGLVYYLNFRYGYSIAPPGTGQDRYEVRERDYFFVAGFALWGVLAGIGLSAAWMWLGRKLQVRARATAPVLAVAAVPLVLNLSWASRTGDYAARDWAYNLLNSLEPYAVFFTNGDNDTFPLWYLQEVEGIRRDVTVVVVQYLFTDWYPKQLRERTGPEQQPPYLLAETGSAGAEPFPERQAPARPVLTLTDEQLAGVGSGPLPDTVRLRLDGFAVEYPANLPLLRGYRIALSIIQNSAAERPIYFAGKSGEMAQLGLSGWGVQEGLATRLAVRDTSAPQPSHYRPLPAEIGGGWIDYPRSVRLADSVYSYRSLLDRDIWPDASTFAMPIQYYAMALGLTVAAEAEGDRVAARRYNEMAAAFLATARGGSKAARP